MQFKQRIEEISKKKKTDIVLALDLPYQNLQERSTLISKVQSILDAVYPYICAVKINHHLILPLGIFDGVQTLVSQAHEHELQTIVDCKVNDIGNTNQIIAKYYFEAGFDALIANPFIGWDEGLKPIFDIAHDLERGVILLTYMSHKGAIEGYGQMVVDPQTGKKVPQYVVFAKKELSWNADGAVVGATVPEKIREIHAIMDKVVPIYSPGVGPQGGMADIARKAGARYLIVGRDIMQAKEPSEVAKRMVANVKY